jgi:predicted dehydrogenase
MVGHTFLYNPGIGKIRQYIIDGRLGRIYYLYARRTNLGPIREDVNALWDLAPHDVSIFNYFLDSTPEWVSAVGAKVLHNSREDVGFISLGYRGGIIGHIHVSWADPHKVREVVVVGSDERVVFNDLDSVERVRVFEKGVTPVESDASSYGDHHLRMRDGDIISPRIDVSEPLRNECAHFLECVSEGKQPLSDGRSGLDVVRTMEAISRSVAQKGAPLELAGVRHHEYQPLHDTSAVR